VKLSFGGGGGGGGDDGGAIGSLPSQDIIIQRQLVLQSFSTINNDDSSRWSVAMQFAPGVKLRLLLVSGLLAVILGAVKIPRL
jgi:hypothetical protein